MLTEFELLGDLRSASGIRLVEPLGDVECMSLVSAAMAVVTDSGGVREAYLQEEWTYRGIPCLTLRENTERPIVTQGSNCLVLPDQLAENVQKAIDGQWPRGSRPDGWMGRTASRCVAALKRKRAELQGKRATL
jgi:UDP-N-acetylglucosamine 2-epimerase (non-hydrolysing)